MKLTDPEIKAAKPKSCNCQKHPGKRLIAHSDRGSQYCVYDIRSY